MIQDLVEEVEAMQVSTPRRSGRKRIHQEIRPEPDTPTPKRKSKPKILTGESLKRFYMNKSGARFARQALETIYEDPHSSKPGSIEGIGKAKIKRSLNMERLLGMATKQKQQSRKTKIKRLGMKAVKLKRLSDEEFKRRLREVDVYLKSEANNSAKVEKESVVQSLPSTSNTEL